MNLRESSPFLRRYWWVIALSFLVGFASTAFFARSRTPSFRATTTLVVGPNENLKAPREIVDSLDTLDRRSVVATFAKIPPSKAVKEHAGQQLQISVAQAEPYEVRAVVIPDTNILEVSVQGPDPQTAASFANAVADQTQAYARELYGIYGIKVLDRAAAPRSSALPGLARSLAAGAALGLLSGVLLALAFDYLRRQKARRVSGRVAEPDNVT